jgi:hypothetical protein
LCIVDEVGVGKCSLNTNGSREAPVRPLSRLKKLCGRFMNVDRCCECCHFLNRRFNL